MAGIDKVVTRTGECDLDTGDLFWDRHRKYFVSLPKFSLDVNNITTRDIWFDFFKNLGRMENIDPSVYDRADEGLLRLIEKAKIGALSEEEYKVYEASMKILADEMDMEEHGYERGVEVGRKEGIEEGKKEGMISTIKMLIESGMPFSEIANRLKISDEELNALLA